MRPRHQPPWWPPEEPWPPTHGYWPRRRHWGGGPPPFVRWLGCLFLAVGGLALLGGVALVVLIIHAFGGNAPGGPVVAGGWIAILLLVFLLGFGISLRRFRWVTAPLAEVMGAAQRVQGGDYTVRVAEPRRGPRGLRDLVRAFNTMTARLEADEQSRRTLLADVSHELRTPLAVIQGEIEAILDGVHPADPEHLEAILDEVHTLSRLVDDLRTLALSEGGTLALHREPTDIGVLTHEVAIAFRKTADDAGVTLRVEAPAELPLVEVDPVRVREVLANLVSNALRHTPPGGSITVTVALSGTSFALLVADTGSGIAPELLPHVFERFVKGAGSRGSGLGLAIAHHLVEAHSGTISAESAPGRGTTIRVQLPRMNGGDG